MFKIISIILCSSLWLFPVIGNCQESISKEQKILNNNIEKIDISISIKPIKDSQYCYNFTTYTKSQINYIIHMLNAIDYVDDGKIVSGADIPIVNINLTKSDSSIDKYGFVCGRFYDTTNKQYAVDSNEYNCFLNFIYALKTEKIVLDDEITFEPSDWAKENVEIAIEKGIVPKWNQIDYSGYINRLEVCQLVDNYLNIMVNGEDYVFSEYADVVDRNPFTDIIDVSIVNLYDYGVVSGKTDTEFYPYDYITREEFAKILSSVYDMCYDSELEVKDVTYYNDQDKISEWAESSVNKVTSLKLFEGDESGKFNPQNNITKEEVITTLLRLSEIEKSDNK